MTTNAQGKPPWACGDCGTTTTPVRRSGPDGPSTLCNACGLRLAKRIKEAGGLSISARKKLALADRIGKNKKRPVNRNNTDSVTDSSAQPNPQIHHHKQTLNPPPHVIQKSNHTTLIQGKTRLEIEREQHARKRQQEQAAALEKANGLRRKMEQARERDLKRNPLLGNPRTMTSADHWERTSWLKQIRQQMAQNWPTTSKNPNFTVNSIPASSSHPKTLTGGNTALYNNSVRRKDVIEALAKEAKKGVWTKLNHPLGTDFLAVTNTQTNHFRKSPISVTTQERVLDNTSQGMSSTTGSGSYSSDPLIEDTLPSAYNRVEISSHKTHVSSSDNNGRQKGHRSQGHDLTRRLDSIQAKSNALLKQYDMLLARHRATKANIANDRRAIMALSVDARKTADQFKRSPGA